MIIEEEIERIENRVKEIEDRMLSVSNVEEYKALAKEHGELKEVLQKGLVWKRKKAEIEGIRQILREEKDEEMKNFARQEMEGLEREIDEIEKELKNMLFGEKTRLPKSIILEIRAGTGGEEAALFAKDLFDMYMKYAEKKKWKTELIDVSLSDLGGFKEVIVALESQDAYRFLRFESGVHRVQRIPETESQGRIHTSTVTVAILPEPDEIEVKINPEDLRVDVFRASGPGGQHVNRTESAVRITHIPTGITVSCQDERSQHKNKAKAMRLLRARLKEKIEGEREREITEERRKQVGTGERSEKIRTYNFPQGRVTDHRAGLTLYKIQQILEGDLDDLLVPLMEKLQSKSHEQRT